MPDTHTIEVSIPVEARLAESLSDPALRARAAEAVNEVLRKAAIDRLFAAMHALSAEAERRGLTDEILEAELAAYNAERRERRTSQHE